MNSLFLDFLICFCTYRLALTVVMSWVIIAVCYFIPHEVTATVLLSMFAVLLSTDITSFFIWTFKALLGSSVRNHHQEEHDHQQQQSVSLRQDCLLIGFHVTFAGVITGLATYYRGDLVVNSAGDRFDSNITNIAVNVLGSLLLVLLVTSYLLQNLQRVFLFSVLRNTFFHKIAGNNNGCLSQLVFAIDKIGKLCFLCFLLPFSLTRLCLSLSFFS